MIHRPRNCGRGSGVNRLYFGDNLEVLARIDDATADLIYLDPPFNSKETYNVLYRSPVGGDAQVRAFDDTWSWEDGASKALELLAERDTNTFNVLRSLQRFLNTSDMMAYLAMMSVRLVELRRVLKPNGSLYLHCDPTACHYLKILLDAVFGGQGFVNHITWKRSHAHSDGKQGSKHYGRISDTILFYARSNDRTWNVQYTPYSQEYVDRDYRRLDPDGRRYRLDNIQGPGGAAKGNPFYEVMGVKRHWRYSEARMKGLIAEGLIIQTRPGAVPQLKRYLDEMPGVPAQEIWTDIPVINNRSKEMLGYATQKPLALLERIIKTSSNEGDVVLDPFCGCGTAIHAAEKLHREWIGIDIAYPAIQIIEDRLQTWLPNTEYEITGIPYDELSARKLAEQDPHTFQQWAVARCGGRSRGKGADRGIDGEIVFKTARDDYGRALVSVKAGKHVNPGMVRELVTVVNREDADMGVFICLEEPTKDMKADAFSAGRIELHGGSRSRVQIVTVKGLIDGPDLGILTVLNTVGAAAAAKAEARKKPPKAPTPEELRRHPPLPPMPISGGKQDKVQVPLDLDEPILVQPQSKTRRA
jgi:site-specific DNA-methyltransferase (adenine-specific)